MQRIIKSTKLNKNLFVFIGLHADRFPILGESHGVCAISGYLKKTIPTLNTQVFDMQVNNKEEILGYIVRHKPVLIGLSVKLYTFKQLLEIYDFIHTIPEEDQALLVLGNAIPNFNGEFILENFFKDVIISIGEGEMTYEDLYNSIHYGLSIGKIRNIYYLENEKITKSSKVYLRGDKIFPPYRGNSLTFFNNGAEVYIEGSRGCAYGNCSICACADFLGSRIFAKKWRPRSIHLIIEDLLILQSMGIKNVTFADEDFMGNSCESLDRIISLSEAIIANEINVKFRMNACVKSFFSSSDTEDIRQKKETAVMFLKQAGLSKVFLGLESGVKSQLKRYRKGFNPVEFDNTLILLNKYNIDCEYGIILLDPLMTFEELQQSLIYIKEHDFTDNIASLFKELRIQVGHDYIKLIRKKEQELSVKILGDFNFDHQDYEILEYADSQVDTFVIYTREWIEIMYKLFYVLRIQTRYSESDIDTLNLASKKNCFDLINGLRKIEFDMMNDFVDIIAVHGYDKDKIRKHVLTYEDVRRNKVSNFIKMMDETKETHELLYEAYEYLKKSDEYILNV